MGKIQKKTGKGRLDKYYHMAKEQGYRARSAFKLVQLNKKYNFLERSKVLIDLCAAPGGWLQVASKMMPVSSLIVGVDLAPIKPLPNVITFVEDITTEKCRATLRATLKTWKADVVLHDGAPNVGAAWVQDAFTQSELVLQSLKLATEFLNKGGSFVTKVFRSKDYNNLMWVFQQLFKKVEATKPPSSRNVSAEIFVVCRDFLAPKKIDPKFLDPKHVFSDVDTGMVGQPMDVFHPEKHKRQREGYEDGNYTLHKTMDVWEFITNAEPIVVLGSVNQFTFKSDDSRKLLKSAETTEEIKECCEDLKVLGKKDFKNLLKWRLSIRLEVGLDKKPEPKPLVAETVEVTPLDDMEAVEEHAAAAAAEESRQDRIRRRQKNERVQKNVQRMQLGMIIPTDIGLEQDGQDGQSLFSLVNIEKAGGLKMVRKGDGNVDPEEFNAELDMGEDIVTGENEDARAITKRKSKSMVKEDIDAEFIDDNGMDSDVDGDAELMMDLDEMYEQYKERQLERDAKLRAKARREDKGEWKGFKKNGSGEEDSDSEEEDLPTQQDDETSDSDSDSGAEDEDGLPGAYNNTKRVIKKSSKNPLLVGLDDAEQAELRQKTESGLTKGAKMFFDQDMFKGLVGEDEEDEEDEEADDESNDDEEKEEEGDEEDVEMDSDEEIRQLRKNRKSLKRKAAEAAEGDEDDDIEMVPLGKEFEDDEMWDGESDEEDSRKRKQINEYSLITAEAMTLAQSLVNKKATKNDLIDQGFTKQAFNEKDGLPAWFLEDETQHNIPNLPITKEAVQVIKDRMKALDARPIKKIAEAKARKKYKAAQKLIKIQKKADAINDTEDISEKEKSIGIAKLLAKAAGAKNKKPKKEVQLVVAKGQNRGAKGRPKGVKGRYKMVDSRMKKELRATKRIAKKAKGSNRRK
ncbi:AdoMet-dependent rRNA methyltransferase spb1 [Podila minutissima]|uniref:AdoMet-dependent rRNA methyltransferase spb1 n=1 Tax=Podila minutissima TaxID=64525 RepID=A0A9P5SPD0_9FUNG|nr:AdoMet-dependent rRNA methyltransferase spb1 [Podila minutissima]